MIAASAAALAFAPSAMHQPLPAFAAARAVRPAMLDLGTAAQWLAVDPIMLPPPDQAADAAAAAAAATDDGGLFNLVFVKPFEAAIVAIHGGLKGIGIEEAYGPAIISFTLALKALTFPLNKQQIESTTKMQAIQPAAKALQEKYRNADPARLNMELQKLYQENQVNPLAGCLPSLAQIPIFIGLYRSVLNLAKEDKLTESFLWLPSLEGPVSDYTEGIGWLTGNADKGYAWNGFNPPLGWHDTLAYLTLPVLLVVSQYISTAILTPKSVSEDPAQQQSQAILKFLPLMIGWFSLNVPSGLGLYWMTNNVVTTLSTVLIRKSVATPELAGAGADASSMPVAPPKPQGFGRQYGEVVSKATEDGGRVTITPPGASTATVDATVVDATVVAEPAAVSSGAASDASPASAGKKKKKKRSKKKKN